MRCLSFKGKISIILSPCKVHPKEWIAQFQNIRSSTKSVKRDTRPINVGMADLMSFRWPVTAITSITHRIAGAVLFVGIAFMLFALDMSLASEAGFETLTAMMMSPAGKFVTWGLLSALAYHFVAGIKHFFMDMGVGETLEGGVFAARATMFFSAALIVLAAIWVYGG